MMNSPKSCAYCVAQTVCEFRREALRAFHAARQCPTRGCLVSHNYDEDIERGYVEKLAADCQYYRGDD